MGDTKWQELTGDPDQLEVKATAYQTVASAISRSTTSLQRIMDDTQTVSEAMDQIRSLAGSVHDDIIKAQSRYSQTGQSLLTYAGHLRDAKDQADPAAKALRDLQEKEATAQSKVNSAKDDHNAAQKALKRAENDADTTPDELERLKKKEKSTKTTLMKASSTLKDIQTDITTQGSLWDEAEKNKTDAGSQAAEEINDAVYGPQTCALNDSVWDKIAAGLDIASTVLGIASLLLGWCPLLSEILSIASFVLSAASFFINLATTGKWDWASFGLLLLSAVPFGVGKLLSKGTKLFAGGAKILEGAAAGVDGAKAASSGAKIVTGGAKLAEGGAEAAAGGAKAVAGGAKGLGSSKIGSSIKGFLGLNRLNLSDISYNMINNAGSKIVNGTKQAFTWMRGNKPLVHFGEALSQVAGKSGRELTNPLARFLNFTGAKDAARLAEAASSVKTLSATSRLGLQQVKVFAVSGYTVGWLATGASIVGDVEDVIDIFKGKPC